jgi:hypothetical protein
MSGLLAPRQSPHRPTVFGLRMLFAVVGAALGGCASGPPPPDLPDIPVAGISPTACASCDEQKREIARLRQDVADRDAELRNLRVSQREQVKVIQESTREVTRAKVKLRRLATQAEAASYIAEVEVALESLRAAQGVTAKAPLLDVAQAMIASSAAPFAEADYEAAKDRAAQAEQLVAAIANSRPPSRSRPWVPGEVLLQMPIPLRVTDESRLLRQPRRGARVTEELGKDRLVVARAYKGNWLRVDTEYGRSGWIEQSRLGVR